MNKLHRFYSAVVLAILAIAATGAVRTADAQGAPRQLRPGQVIETGGGITERIIRCRGTGGSEECETQAYRNGDAVGVPTWTPAASLRAAIDRVEAARRPAAPAGRPATTPANPQAGNRGQRPAQPRAAAGAQCNYAPPAPAYSQRDPFSANLAKRNIYDGYARAANGTGVAPLRVAVAFLAFTVGTPYRNAVRNVPGRGAERINDAAPPNATIYRVQSRHVVCEEYRDGVQRREVTSTYDCFRSRDGEWVCGSGGSAAPRIIQLNRR